MAKKINNTPIENIHTDWEDYSGEQVQKFIKGEFEKRFGTIYYDEANEQYLAFSDEESKEKYLSDRENNTDLLLGSWSAPANFSAEISMTSEVDNYISSADIKGVYLEFDYVVRNKQGADVGGNVLCITKIGTQTIRGTYSGNHIKILLD